MKTIEDFKGGKNEFLTCTTTTGQHKISDKNGFRVATLGWGDEAEANARLFANSKKVLEAAIELMRFSASLKVIADEKLQYPDNCKDAFDKLEQAINDSL